MPVLRVFTSPGFGTVLTGIPVSGRVALGDRLEVQPGSRTGRVRGLQVYHRAADHASAGHRTAVNLADLEHRAVKRGDVLCVPAVFDGDRLLDVRLELLGSVPRPVRHNQEVRLHVGTLECAARVLLVGRRQAVPGETAWAQLKLDRPAVTAPGDRFILRVPSELQTLGGGVVLGPGEHLRSKGAAREREFAERERGLTDLAVAVASHLRRAALRGTDRARVARELKRRDEEVEPVLARLVAEGGAVELARGLLVHGETAARGEERLVTALTRFHERHALAWGTRKALLPDEVGGDPAVVDGLLERLRARGAVEPLDGGRVRLAGRLPELTEGQAARRDQILEVLTRDPWQTPRSDDLATLVGGPPSETDQLLALLQDEGRIVRLREGVLLSAEAVAEAKEKIAAHVRERGSLVPADLKELVGATRKYSIPLLEHLDATGFTRRQGDVRLLR
jgi:selenocysteine-specific elongation factor